MKRKICAILLLAAVLISLCTAMPAVADKKEILKNGGFEEISDTGGFKYWSLTGGSFGKEFLMDKDAHSGNVAMKITGDSHYFASQGINLVEGAEYVFSVWLKIEQKKGTGSMVKIEFDGGSPPVEKELTAGNSWEQKTVEFVAPAGETHAILLIRLLGGGTLYYDDASLLEDTSKIKKTEDGKTLIETVKNGGFEQVTGSTPENWAAVGGSFGRECTITDNAHSGKNAIQIQSDGNCYVSQSFRVKEDSPYKLSLWFNKVVKSAGAMVKIEFTGTDEDGGEIYLKPFEKELLGETNKWTQLEEDIVSPKKAKNATILIRLLGGGTVLYDDVSLLGEGAEPTAPVADVPEEPAEVAEEPLSGAENLIKNGGFEDGQDNWNPWKGAWNEVVSIEEGHAYSGNRCLRIATESGGLPWACQQVTDIYAGARYRVTAWVQVENSATSRDLANVMFKFEFYSIDANNNSSYSESVTRPIYANGGRWVQMTQMITMPENCKRVLIYPRLYGNGVMRVDDVTCYQTSMPPAFYAETDNYIYYTEWYSGTASARVNSSLPQYFDGTFDFRMYDGETVVFSKENVKIADGAAQCTFKVSELAEIGKRYEMEITLKDKAGAEVESQRTPMYRYNRPSRIRADGKFVQDGKVFDPIMAYHLPEKDYEAAAAAGINLVQAYKPITSDKAMLDHAHRLGMKVLFPLYVNMKPAGHPDNIANTISMVKNYHDHPALFGWMMMDEPYNNDVNPEEDLLRGYTLIKSIDPDAVIFTMENIPSFYRKVGKFVDVLGIDPYPGDNGTQLTYVDSCMQKALAAVDYKKPVYALLQAFAWPTYFPTSDEMRHMLYDAFLAGGMGIGYYCYENAQGGNDLNNTPLWETLVSFCKNECADAFAAFVHGKYPIFNEGKDSNVWYKSYVKDGTLYMVVLNETKNPITAQIPLTSFDGTQTVKAFTATGGGNTVTGTDGVLTVSLRAAEATVYRIDSDVKVTSTVPGKYIDLLSVPWARTAIESLAAKGIVNEFASTSYRPQDPITRGDFAYFLVRTLGLTGSAEPFTDVDNDIYYAKELAAGKAAGILLGIGENRYNPDGAITRQDMMTIISRGMQLAGEADLSAFSDGEMVAEYATEHVKAMIASGLIKGNADGTINPLGNTTRAEAAVIMYRILNHDVLD